MARRRLRVLLIGEEAAGIQALRGIALCGKDDVVAVLASPEDSASRTTGLWAIARRLGFPAHPARLVKEGRFAEWIRSMDVDVLLNVHSMHIIHREALTAPRIGSFNLHPGPLPRYAGLNALSWAIYNGEKEYGVTLHEMTEQIDAGPIAYQERFPLLDHDTPVTLAVRCVQTGIPLLLRLLDAAASGRDAIPLTTQDPVQRRYFGREVPNGGRISWDLTARQVVDFVRACRYDPFPSPWGRPRALLGGREVVVAGATRTGRLSTVTAGTVEYAAQGALVACADEWVILQGVSEEGQSAGSRHIAAAPGARTRVEESF